MPLQLECQTMDQRSKDSQSIAPLRAFVVDDRPVVFDGVDALRANASGSDLAPGAHASGTHAAVSVQANVAVLDLSDLGLDGIESAREFIASSPECRVLAVVAQHDGVYLRQLQDLGVYGYVSKGSSAAELLRGIQTVGNCGIYRDPAVVEQAPRRTPAPATCAERGTVAELSTREIEVLKLAAAGHSNKTIAAKLQIGSKSVETYKARGMAKLGFHTRVEVVRFALSLGWLSES
jgi:DNA-binding NarL/FixJ family response regulator